MVVSELKIGDRVYTELGSTGTVIGWKGQQVEVTFVSDCKPGEIPLPRQVGHWLDESEIMCKAK